MIIPIISLLDGSNDFTTPEEELTFQAQLHEMKTKGVTPPKKSTARYEATEKNALVVTIKKKIIDILFLVKNLQDDLRLTHFLTAFHKADNELVLRPQDSGPELTYLQRVVNDEQFTLEEEEKFKDVKKRCDEKIIHWMKASFAHTALDMKR